MKNPTKTTNRIHFEDIDHSRFEDLCFMLIYPLHPWVDIRGRGRSGSDAGVDIIAVENVESGENRLWYIQCKRYQKATPSTLVSILNDAILPDTKVPDVFLTIISCDISKKAQDAYIKKASEIGIGTPLLWTSQTLESILYNKRTDLLFVFFDISMTKEQRSKERTIIRNILLKRRFRKDFLKDMRQLKREDLWADSTIKFKYKSVIIHSIDDTSYPAVEDSYGISSWFKLNPYDFYFNGIEFVLFIEYVIVDRDGNWALIEYDQEYDETVFNRFKVFKIGQIPYRNIVDYDIDGDEYYSEPHIYCRFSEGGEPYESFKWVSVDGKYQISLSNSDKFDYSSIK